jgi:hypothetical protein
MQRILAIMAGAGCLLALLDMPSEYYKVLRFVVVAACIASILQFKSLDIAEKKRNALYVVFGLLAIIFNPFVPLEMERGEWLWFNIAGVLILFGTVLSPLHAWNFIRRRLVWIIAICSLAAVIAGTIYLPRGLQILRWQHEASRSEFHRYRLLYNDNDYLNYVVEGKLMWFTGMTKALNMSVCNWVSFGAVSRDEYYDDSEEARSFKRLIFESDDFDERLSHEDALAAIIRGSLNAVPENGTGVLTLGGYQVKLVQGEPVDRIIE